ncbi:MAG: aspartate aminotransferase family protein [Candidatus Glassbacteria bacterium]|nr:aspartate aminotransferase family protein [Candidatus Glassbacteria bacterium]
MAEEERIIREDARYVLGTYVRPKFVIERGQGCYLFDTEGRRYLDLVGGIAVNALGYGDEQLSRVIAEQARKLIHCSNLYYTAPNVALARMLVESCSFADKVFFCNSGAEAVEGAMKLARKWAMKKFGGERAGFVAFTGSFHGRTFGALALTDRKKYRMPFEPLVPGARFARFGDADDAETKIGVDTCAVIVEPVQGEGGVNPAGAHFLTSLAEVCHRRRVLLIFDEVQCGLGRTGRLFAYQHFGVVPDILCLAKPLAGGLPMGAVLANRRVAECIESGDHATTFGGGLVVSAAAIEVLRRLKRPSFLASVANKGEYLLDRLKHLKKKFPDKIATVRGLGLMVGVELSFEAAPLLRQFRERGVLVCTAGEKVIRAVPPLIISKRQIDRFIHVFADILEKRQAAPEDQAK